ncbi:MBL fold metallo-hydrolase [Deinococcus sp.]|uniref:MBL fold metallo-hydrolase n=1 Tax=Deinococcus sp. TaxID=47478 RepID=UPI002869AC82|nr:MBL fold metallo-hydrolase [Deinococcus sp.]
MKVNVRRLYANTYLLDTPDGKLMVDSGSQLYAPVFPQLLRDFRPDGLALTHAHVDHSGGAWIAAQLGVPVYAHPLERPALTGLVHDLPYPSGLPAVGRAVSRLHIKLPGTALTDVMAGMVLHGWEVVPLPGHTPGQVGLRREGVLVAGDAVIGSRDGAHLPRAAYNADHGQALDTLRRMADLDLQTVLPGHGRPLSTAELRARASRDDQGREQSAERCRGSRRTRPEPEDGLGARQGSILVREDHAR